jgi:hypothetical protein
VPRLDQGVLQLDADNRRDRRLRASSFAEKVNSIESAEYFEGEWGSYAF